MGCELKISRSAGQRESRRAAPRSTRSRPVRAAPLRGGNFMNRPQPDSVSTACGSVASFTRLRHRAPACPSLSFKTLLSVPGQSPAAVGGDDSALELSPVELGRERSKIVARPSSPGSGSRQSDPQDSVLDHHPDPGAARPQATESTWIGPRDPRRPQRWAALQWERTRRGCMRRRPPSACSADRACGGRRRTRHDEPGQTARTADTILDQSLAEAA